MEYSTVGLDGKTDKLLSLYLYTNVRNTKEIREKLISGRMPCCMIKASLVLHPLQVVISANKAAIKEKRSKLTTKSVFTETLYLMSASNKITDSLVKFGINDDDTNIVVALIYELGQIEQLEEEVLGQIEGDRMPILKVTEFSDESEVRKLYNIEKDELAVSSLLYSVISRIACNACGISGVPCRPK